MTETGRAWVLVFFILQVVWISVNGQVLQGEFTILEEFFTAVWPNSTYNATVSPCDWRPESFNCTTNGQITEITQNNLSMTLGELSNLTRLQTLDLSRNNFTGYPQSVGNLSRLSFLNLSSNDMNGPVLQDVVKLTRLKTLDLSHNKFSGNISNVFRDLQDLEYIDLSFNDFDGEVPISSLCNPQSIQSVNLSSNKFTGNFSTQPSDQCNELFRLDLSNNKLVGAIPPEIFQFFPKLSVLDLKMNNFSGPFSVTTGAQGQSLTEINLESNSFGGPFPQELLQLRNLLVLKLGKNSFTGTFNSSIVFPTTLQELDLHSNNLSGTIPPLSQIQSLRQLDLSSNAFTGDFPSNISLLLNLTRISLADNSFLSYSFPALDGLTNLEVLDLSGTNLSGTIPSSIVELNASLVALNLSRNSLEGEIPSVEISRLKKLAILDMSSNNLVGNISIPYVAGELNETLNLLNLSRNNLGGEIPPVMGTLIKLFVLDLSHNQLEGEIPRTMTDLTDLSQLDLSFNRLSGEIPLINQWLTFPNSSFLNNSGLCSKINLTGIPSCPRRAPSPSPSAVPLSALSTDDSSKKNLGLIVGLVTGLSVLLIVLLGLLIWCRVTMAVKPLVKDESPMTREIFSGPLFLQQEKDPAVWTKVSTRDPHTIPVVMFEKPLLKLTFADVLRATSNFSKELQIADGGYGPVYKATLADGTQLAIKVLLEVKFTDVRDAEARIEELTNMNHPNLVALVGYCLVGEDSLLIYDFMANGDLYRWLHELHDGNRNPEDWPGDTWESTDSSDVTLVPAENVFDWPTRHKIALGAARALAFLHHGCSPPVIHQDVKSRNVLLDDNFEAHLVDCGLAGIAKPHTPVMGGTVGYVPPEYGQSWQATPRGDVYSFGVVLMELVTGRKPTGLYFRDSYGGNLVGWVRFMAKEKKSNKLLDRRIARKVDEDHMLEVLRIARLCTAESPAKRPTMQQVVGLLRDCQP
ncbi:hypothetical protein R1sor_011025 [Riccia sorocarpa]|uniref:non-specific serine/threonine protein kinase n=1 Tax=Riccia sorocarpa TaxID=122646 RepID=A0ABD3I5S5_9MARC